MCGSLPSPSNGLARPCSLEIDKLGAIPTAWLGRGVGTLHHDDQAIAIALCLSAAVEFWSFSVVEK
jgi:hypothetical protein